MWCSVVMMQFCARVRRRPHRRRHATVRTTEDNPTKRHADQVYTREPAAHHVGRKCVSAVFAILLAVSRCRQKAGHITSWTLYARSVHYEYREPFSSAHLGGKCVSTKQSFLRMHFNESTCKAVIRDYIPKINIL